MLLFSFCVYLETFAMLHNLNNIDKRYLFLTKGPKMRFRENSDYLDQEFHYLLLTEILLCFSGHPQQTTLFNSFTLWSIDASEHILSDVPGIIELGTVFTEIIMSQGTTCRGP